ncbi:MAG: hypothetical protein V1816_26685 [Pseudomonadota bacterium]
MWLEFLTLLDRVFLPVFRWPDRAILGFYLGVFCLSAVAALLGDLAFNLAVRADRKRIEEMTRETAKMSNLSLEALQAGDGGSYRACNKMANDAFGKLFFLQAALSMASLWPAPFALAWLQYRFSQVEFPLPFGGWKLNYIGMFLLIYILTRILYGRLGRRLPFFRGAKKILVNASAEHPLKSWGALLSRAAVPKA